MKSQTYGDNFLEEIHHYGIDRYNFELFLTSTPKTYSGGDTEFSEPGIEYQMATRFITNITILSHIDKKRPILTHMKTDGGVLEEGVAVYNIICACPNPVTILSYTSASSASSVILQAADKRVLMPHSHFMFHYIDFSVAGNTKCVSAHFESGMRDQETMINIYAERLKKRGKYSRWSKERIKEMLIEHMDKNEDVFLSPEEAVEWGFADEVFDFNWDKVRTSKKIK